MKNLIKIAHRAKEPLSENPTRTLQSGKGVVTGTPRQPLMSSLFNLPTKVAAILCLLMTLGVGSAWGETITLTAATLDLGGSYTSSSKDVSNVTFQWVDLCKQTYIQAKASTGELWNTKVVPGKITNVSTTNNGTSRTSTLYWGTTAKPTTNSSSINGTSSTNSPANSCFGYIHIKRGSNAQKWTQVVITYTPATITLGKTSITGLDYTAGSGPSSSGTFTVSGSNIPANLTITAPTNFEVSLDGSSWGSSKTINVTLTNSASAGTLSSKTVYVRLASGKSEGDYSGNVSIAMAGCNTITNVNPKTVAVSGTVSASAPSSCTAPTGLTKGSITSTSVELTITDGANTGTYELYYNQTGTAPTSGTGASSTVTTTTPTVTGLKSGETYYMWVRAKCSNTSKSDWVALTGATFTTTCGDPSSLTNGAVTDATTGQNGGITVSWSGAPDNYEVYFHQSSSAPASDKQASRVVDGAKSCDITGLTAGQYWWWARSNCSSGKGDWIAGSSFTIAGIKIGGTTPVAFGTVAQGSTVADKTIKVTGIGLSSGTSITAAFPSGSPFSVSPTSVNYNASQVTLTISASSATVGVYDQYLTLSYGATYTTTVRVTMTVVAEDKFIDALQNTTGYEAATPHTETGTYSTPSLLDMTIATTGTCEQTHYHFVGWITKAKFDAGTDIADADLQTPTTASNATYYAVWAEQGSGGGSVTWTRVTSMSDLTSGGTFIMGYEATAKSGVIVPLRSADCNATTSANGYFNTGTTTSSSTNGTIDMSSVSTTSDYEVYISCPTSGKINIQRSNSSGNYYGATSGGTTSNKGRLYTSGNSTETNITPEWASEDNNQFKLSTGVSGEYKYLKYNTGAPRFAFYNSAGEKVVFYKKGGGVTYTDYKAICCTSYTVTLTGSGTISGAGTFSASPASACEGNTVTLSTDICAGYTVGDWTVTKAGGGTVTVTSNQFTMPAENVTVSLATTAKVDHFIDRMHNTTNYTGEGYAVSGCNQTVPTISDKSKGSECEGEHYKFVGWVAEDKVDDDGTLLTGYTVVQGGTTSWNASGTNYYAVWAKEE